MMKATEARALQIMTRHKELHEVECRNRPFFDSLEKLIEKNILINRGKPLDDPLSLKYSSFTLSDITPVSDLIAVLNEMYGYQACVDENDPTLIHVKWW